MDSTNRKFSRCYFICFPESFQTYTLCVQVSHFHGNCKLLLGIAQQVEYAKIWSLSKTVLLCTNILTKPSCITATVWGWSVGVAVWWILIVTLLQHGLTAASRFQPYHRIIASTAPKPDSNAASTLAYGIARGRGMAHDLQDMSCY